MNAEHRQVGYVPLSVRRSRVVAWLWPRAPWLAYRPARALARLLP